MKMLISVSVLSILLESNALNIENDHIRSVFLLILPGTSSPEYAIPTMNWKDWLEKGPAELTAYGMREQYILGKQLRAKYELLLNSTKLYQSVKIRTINTTRSIASTEAFIQGFIYETEETLSDDELLLSLPPFPIDPYIISTVRNRVLPYSLRTFPFHSYYPPGEDVFDSRACPNANELAFDSLNRSTEARKIVAQHQSRFYEIIKKSYGFKEKDWPYPLFVPLLNSIIIAGKLGKNVNMTDSEYILLSEFAQALYPYELSGDLGANQLRSCRVLQFVLNRLKDTQSKLLITFISEEIMASLLAYIGHGVAGMIPSSSLVALELHSINGELYVSMWYNEREIRIPDCGFPLCKYSMFEAVVRDLCQKKESELSY